MKTFFAFCLLAAVSAYEDALREVLKSPKATLKLYQDFKVKENLKFGNTEDRMRMRIFRRSAEFVMTSNEVFEDTADYRLNFFSTKTEDEKSQYLGLNVTSHLANAAAPVALKSASTPIKKLWVKEGAVTEVKNQGGCGSCWTFGAVGGLETRYKALSGRLRSFAEQEYLDCINEGKENGCQGGWPENCYLYSKNQGGRLAASVNYPYRGNDGACLSSSKPNDLVAYKIDGYQYVAGDEQSNIEALAKGSLSVCFEVTKHTQYYWKGVMRDYTCTGSPNHAVTAVGYTAYFVLVKNSWGTGWGEQGFIKFARNHDNCSLFKYSVYPKLVSTGRRDTGASDKAAVYDPEKNEIDPIPDPDCKDISGNCYEVVDYCDWDNIGNKQCRKTCGACY